MHVVIDAVNLKGNGFEVLVEPEQDVKAGELLMKFYLKIIREKYKATVMVVVENSDTMKCNIIPKEEVEEGGELIKLEKV